FLCFVNQQSISIHDCSGGVRVWDTLPCLHTGVSYPGAFIPPGTSPPEAARESEKPAGKSFEKFKGKDREPLQDVQPCHSRATLDVEVSELRQRSTLSVPPMASQSACTGVDGNQVHTLRSPVPSIRGTADRHPSPRVFGSPVVLDDVRSRKEAARFQDLLQQPSHAYLTGRANTRDAGVTTNRKSPLVWLAAPLSILISDPNGCLTFQIFGLTEVSGQ